MESTDKPATEQTEAENPLSEQTETESPPSKELPRIPSQEDIKKAQKVLIKSDSEMLLSNRQDYLMFNRFKIYRNLITLSEIDRLIYLVVPRLLHVHQEGLPGYFEGNPPCGIHNFTLDKEAQIASRNTCSVSQFYPGSGHSHCPTYGECGFHCPNRKVRS